MRIVFPTLCLLAGAMTFLWAKEGRPGRSPDNTVTKSQLSQLLGKQQIRSNGTKTGDLDVQFSVDQRIQQNVEEIYRRGGVPYGAFVAIDPRTGQVLSMVSHGKTEENLALRATFPAASIFKIVTAAAAIEGGKLQHDSLIPVRGSFHTLYKRNVLAAGGIEPTTGTRFSRLISFEDALAKSVNSVFGKVGIFGVGGDGLKKTALLFGFGSSIPFELPVESDHVIVPDDEFGVAETASGYTRNNTLSPLHGALIAAAIANEGVMMEPSIVSHAATQDGKTSYAFEPHPMARVLDKQAATEVGLMMHRTIVNGTSSRVFRRADHSIELGDVFIAGKTGTLNGWDPEGRYDWFVGYADKNGQKIAVAAMCVHGSRYGVKASQIARAAFETYFSSTVASDTTEMINHSAKVHHRRHHHARRTASA